MAAALAALSLCTNAQDKAALWLTKSDKSVLFELQKDGASFTGNAPAEVSIEVDPGKTYQTMDGFGFALTGGSAMHMIRMDKASRAALLKELFDTEGSHIGVSYLRVSIGASDLNQFVFTYDDLPSGQTDVNMGQAVGTFVW
jgi:glucosylceramidase